MPASPLPFCCAGYPRAVLSGLALLLAAGHAVALPPSLEARAAWVRHVPGSDTAAVYCTVHNPTAQAVVVVGVRSAAARDSMMHATRITGGQSQMRALDQVRVPAGASVAFSPEGMHIMLSGLHGALVVGELIPLALQLADGSELRFQARVRPLVP